MSILGQIFWRESIWLPEGYTWKHLENKPDSGIYIAQRDDMLWSVIGGLIMLVIRYFFEKFVFTPIGYRLGVKRKKACTATPNPVLEEEFKMNGLVSNNNLETVAKKTDMSVREVERWLRERKEISKPSSIQRFNEISWQFLFYSVSFTYGMIVLWNTVTVCTVFDETAINENADDPMIDAGEPKDDEGVSKTIKSENCCICDRQVALLCHKFHDVLMKSWFWVTKYCWKNWPYLRIMENQINIMEKSWKYHGILLKKDVGRDVYWYYMFELSFYWSLVYTMLTDHKRKDFNQMMVHHAATILLVYFSWALNFARIGTLVFILHDVGDIPLALAKMFKYCGKESLPELCFGVFIVIWILSRLIYYPFVVLHSAIFELQEEMGGFPAHYFFISLLIMLQLLHIMWSYMIAKSAYLRIFQGRTHDVRSDSESD